MTTGAFLSNIIGGGMLKKVETRQREAMRIAKEKQVFVDRE